ncbi:N-acetyltransferase [Aerococcus agrisoli]|uniref:N-acetyltransferase n=1 Tax=Aerococcus agrisoli TaxID=2487350 RepID=A0A3N4GD91_9LACT|nr:GNAT family protein [Aerococcus agrisoli]RPA60793.1 N-acetyltransferase [Aerococcus agrisoli]
MHYFKIQLSDQVALIKPTLEMSESIYKLVVENKAYIGEFLDFVDNVEKDGVKSQKDFLILRFNQEAEGTARQYMITYNDEIVGSIDLHNIIEDFKRAEVGYWLSPEVAGKGVMSLAVQAVLAIAFEDMDLNKVLLMADVENIASNRVAQKNHFTLEGTHRKDTPLRGEYRDINVYGILQSEFLEKA